MDAHGRWLTRIGAVLVLAHAFTAPAISLAEQHGLTVPRIFRPANASYIVFSTEGTPLFSPISHVILGTVVLATFGGLRSHKGLEVAQMFMALLLFAVVFVSSASDWVRCVVPALTIAWMMGRIFTGGDAGSLAAAARLAIPAIMLGEFLLSMREAEGWIIFRMGIPFAIAGAVMMIAGELLCRRRKPEPTSSSP